MSDEIVWPAKQFDAIKALADKLGGIGYGLFYKDAEPCCGYGMAHAAGFVRTAKNLSEDALQNRLFDIAGLDQPLGFSWEESDDAVYEINTEMGREFRVRVPFDQWAERMHVVRGEAES